MSNFKEYEQMHLGEMADTLEAQEEQEAQKAPETQEPLTAEEISRAGEALHKTAVALSRLTNPEAEPADAISFAHTPYYLDYIADALRNDKASLCPEIQANAGKIPKAAQKAQEAYKEWRTIKTRFYASEQWRQLQEAFNDITGEQVEWLLFNPAIIWQTVDALPEVKAEISSQEKETGRPLTFQDLLMPAGDTTDSPDPHEMLLSVLLHYT